VGGLGGVVQEGRKAPLGRPDERGCFNLLGVFIKRKVSQFKRVGSGPGRLYVLYMPRRKAYSRKDRGLVPLLDLKMGER